MKPTIITARVTDQHLQLVNEALVVSGSWNVLQIRFEFCGLWTGGGKTAVFYRSPEEVYHVPIASNLVTVPWEVLTEEGHFYLGVFGVKSNLRPTEVVRIDVAPGVITTANATPEEPTPDVYQQILTTFGAIDTHLGETDALVRELTETSAVYIGSGDMPENYKVQIDPNGDVLEMESEIKKDSKNPVEGKAIYTALAKKADKSAVEAVAGDVTTLQQDVGDNHNLIIATQNALEATMGDVTTLQQDVGDNHNLIIATQNSVEYLMGEIEKLKQDVGDNHNLIIATQNAIEALHSDG